jgi:hypothetical protein
VRRTGHPITGAEYAESYLGYEQHRLIVKREPDLSVFEADELDSVDLVLEDLAHLTATQVSALSHAEPGWLLVDDGDVIPYEAALIAPEQVQTETSRRLVAETAERYGALSGK